MCVLQLDKHLLGGLQYGSTEYCTRVSIGGGGGGGGGSGYGFVGGPGGNGGGLILIWAETFTLEGTISAKGEAKNLTGD